MLSLEPELEALRPVAGERTIDALIARERREIFSVYPELRICGWAGATLLAGAAGILLENNLERLGPIAIAAMIAVAAAACYSFVVWRRDRASLVDDYVLLLGALLVSADVAFLESQFHLFGAHWRHHLILLAVLHGAGAYLYRSRMLLSLSITALAGWLGADRNTRPDDLTIPAFTCAAILIAWRELDRRQRATGNRQPATSFTRTFEHFAANLALAGGLTLIDDQRTLGCILTLVIAAAVIWWGFRTRSEPFVLYAFVYGVIAFDVLLIETFFTGNEKAALLVVVGSMIGAIAALLALHARFKEARA